MGREGLAFKRDWSANRAAVLADKQTGWASLEGNQVYLDLVIGGRRDQTIRLVFALFLDQVPLAAANFHALCAHKYEGLGEGGQPLTYKRSKIHRVERGSFLQGGQLHGLGSGGDSIYGSAGFDDEPFGLQLRHDAPGILSMANRGPDTNRSQFLITTGACPSLDGSHVVVGRIVSGAARLQALDSVPTDASGRPSVPIEISECGILPAWHRAPLPLPDAPSAVGGAESLLAVAQAQRAAVASAVNAALLGKRAADGGAGSSGAGPAGGAGEAKRQAVARAMDPLAGIMGEGEEGEEDSDDG